MSPALSIVVAERTTETLGAKVQRLQREAKAGAREHVAELGAMLEALRAMAADIANGGDAYGAGPRDLARNVAQACELHGQTLEAITGRGRP